MLLDKFCGRATLGKLARRLFQRRRSPADATDPGQSGRSRDDRLLAVRLQPVHRAGGIFGVEHRLLAVMLRSLSKIDEN